MDEAKTGCRQVLARSLFLYGARCDAFCTAKNITGTVRDKLGESLIGVSVLVENTTNGTITDFDGNYSIVASEGDVLLFSYVGMETQRKTVSRSNVIDVTLEENSVMLTETVVIGYGSAKNGI